VDYADPAFRYLYGDTRTSSGEPASLERPLVLYKRTEDGRTRYVEHPLYGVLHDRPNPVAVRGGLLGGADDSAAAAGQRIRAHHAG
jgi:hypothetical protein